MRHPLALLALLAAPLVASPGCDRSPSRPNVVLLVIDSLRADLLGCYGSPLPTSPELDALARRGVLFRSVTSQTSWTRPSIASLLTSMYPRSLGIHREKFDVLRDEYLTLAEVFSEAGYLTLGCTANPNLNEVFNFQQGFEDYRESSVSFQWMGAGGGGEAKTVPRTDEVFDWVLDRVPARGDRPVYVQLVIMEVHSPRLRRAEYEPLFADLPVHLGKRELSPEESQRLHRLVRGTHAALRQVSRDIGRFVDRLSTRPGWENTLFVITSDHGQGLDTHPDVVRSSGHGNLLYESQTHVPLLLVGGEDDPVPPGARVDERVRLLDVMPTLLELADVPVPESAVGVSLAPLVTGEGRAPRLPDVFVTETRWRRAKKLAARGETWKYIENRDRWTGVNRHELQSNESVENGILTDRIGERADEAEKLAAELERWERRFPVVPSTQPADGPGDDELEQLRALGYID